MMSLMTHRAAVILTTMILRIIKEFVTVLESKSGQMAQSIRVTGWRTEHRERVFSGMQMGTFLKVNSKTTSPTDTVFIPVRMELNTMACGSTIFSTVRAQPPGLMGRPTPATTFRVRSTE